MCLFIDVSLVHLWRIALEKLLAGFEAKGDLPICALLACVGGNPACTRPHPPLAPLAVPGVPRVSGPQLRQREEEAGRHVVLVSAQIELIFFLVTGRVLCFGFSMGIPLRWLCRCPPGKTYVRL